MNIANSTSIYIINVRTINSRRWVTACDNIIFFWDIYETALLWMIWVMSDEWWVSKSINSKNNLFLYSAKNLVLCIQNPTIKAASTIKKWEYLKFISILVRFVKISFKTLLKNTIRTVVPVLRIDEARCYYLRGRVEWRWHKCESLLEMLFLVFSLYLYYLIHSSDLLYITQYNIN